MELDELGVLNWESSSGDHTATITSTGMGRGAREIGSTVSTSGHNGLEGLHSVDSTISHVVGHDTSALTIFHNQIHGKVLDEEDAIVTEGSSKESVEHAVTCSISYGAASVSLTTFTKFLRLSTECSLVNLTLLGS